MEIDGGDVILPDHHLAVGKGVALAGIAVVCQNRFGYGQGQLHLFLPQNLIAVLS